MTVPLSFHPLADIFPMMEGQELDALAADIRKNDLREPIMVFENKILDGRNRAVACEKVGVKPRYANYLGKDPVGFVVSLNLRRRHLDESQRAMVGDKLASLGQGQTRKFAGLPTQTETAKLLNVSERSIQTARAVRRDGAPELVKAVETGAISVSTAAEIATLPKADQAEVVSRDPDEIIREANRIKRGRKEERKQERRREIVSLASVASPASGRHDLRKASCAEAMNLDAESIDWIITDPPYPKEFLPTYADLGALSAHVLKPGGSLLCMIGQSYMPEIVATLAAHLDYHWTLAYLTPGGQAAQIFPRRINTFWKPVLWFVKGEYSGNWIGDAVTSKVNDNDKRFHEWGQSESGMRDLMARFIKPGETILDPFMGAGTTGVVALDLGAKFLGFDTDEASFNEAVVRMDRASLVA